MYETPRLMKLGTFRTLTRRGGARPPRDSRWTRRRRRGE
ncbi:lasso RiPP family leader peptide-containing protein [Saccharothrix obliqua]|nr:lasso RiPP family leader peptide-containing protein [Saccharothrix obliqua]